MYSSAIHRTVLPILQIIQCFINTMEGSPDRREQVYSQYSSLSMIMRRGVLVPRQLQRSEAISHNLITQGEHRTWRWWVR